MGKYKQLQCRYNELQREYAEVLAESAELADTCGRLMERQDKFQSQEEEIRKLHKSARMLKHDMRNHFMVLSSYLAAGEYEEAKLYSSEILDKLNAMSSYVETGNSLMNHIVNEKLQTAREQGIRIKAEIENLSFKRMKSIDFSALLTNMLDNALRACGFEEEGRRELHLHISSQRGYDVICVKNRIAESVLEQNPELRSSRQETTSNETGTHETESNDMGIHGMDIHGMGIHGMGIPGMKEIAEGYNGILDIYESEGFFCVSAYIPK